MAEGGAKLTELAWKILTSVMTAAVLGGYGMFYSMHTDLTELKLQRTTQAQQIAKLEAELAAERASRDGIKSSLTKIETELPYIKQGIADLKEILSR